MPIAPLAATTVPRVPPPATPTPPPAFANEPSTTKTTRTTNVNHAHRAPIAHSKTALPWNTCLHDLVTGAAATPLTSFNRVPMPTTPVID